jgi:hypothetical protein
MANEGARIIKRKRIKLPNGDTVDLPVISQITFNDVPERGQDTQYTFDNSTDADRDMHIAFIPGNGQPTDETGDSTPDSSAALQVERIDRFRLLDSPDRGQETFPEPDSKTVAQPPDAPPYFTTHAKTHIVKYVKRNDDDTEDDNIFIKSELIDQINFLDAPERGQETFYTLANPPLNQEIDGLRFGADPSDIGNDGNPIATISVDPTVDEITTGVGGSDEGDAPVRTDPFQNIVDWSGGGIFVIGAKHFTVVDEVAPATYLVSKNGIDWTPFEEAFDIAEDPSTTFNVAINIIAGGLSAFYLAGSVQHSGGGPSSAVKTSTDNGKTWQYDSPPGLVAGGTAMSNGWYDAKPPKQDDPDLPPNKHGFRLVVQKSSGIPLEFWSSPNLKSDNPTSGTWTKDGDSSDLSFPYHYPNTWGPPPMPNIVRGTDATGAKIYVYLYNSNIWVAPDDGTGLPDYGNSSTDPPNPWSQVYTLPNPDDPSYSLVSTDPLNYGGLSGLAAADVSQGLNDAGAIQKGTTFVAVGEATHSQSGSYQWINAGPLGPMIRVADEPNYVGTWKAVYEGQVIARFTVGGIRIGVYDTLAQAIEITGDADVPHSGLVTVKPFPGATSDDFPPDSDIFNSPAIVYLIGWVPDGSSADFGRIITVTSVGGSVWTLNEVGPINATGNIIGSSDPSKLVLKTP